MDKYILLTGASSGIGKATAKLLADNGYKIIATVRNEQDKIDIEKLSININCYICDVTKEIDILNLKQEILKLTNRLYSIINNAGVAYTSILEAVQIEDIKEQFEINTFAPLLITREFLPLLSEGKIINVSSISSNIVYPFISPYCASKRSLDIFFQALELEIDNRNIKIVSIKPATIKTPIWDKSHKLAKEKFDLLPINIQKKYRNTLDKLLVASEKSAQNGISADSVAKLILRILQSKNPKRSYSIGITSHLSKWFSMLSVDLQCFISKKLLFLKKK